MALQIQSTNILGAWQEASSKILLEGPLDNLLITIDKPCIFDNLDTIIKNRNPKSINSNANNIRHVINTIFPYNLASLCPNRQFLYTKYKEIYLNGTGRKSWGTYFQRLVSYDNHFTNNGLNQLENAIVALNGGSPQKHYIVFHLSCRNLDSNTRPMGAPCWHFGEITINEDKSLNLVVVYRMHDYFQKALGNFIGLAKLLEFICKETNRATGKLIIHSIHAYNGASVKSNLAALIL
jgi:thymidylate synthase